MRIPWIPLAGAAAAAGVLLLGAKKAQAATAPRPVARPRPPVIPGSGGYTTPLLSYPGTFPPGTKTATVIEPDGLNIRREAGAIGRNDRAPQHNILARARTGTRVEVLGDAAQGQEANEGVRLMWQKIRDDAGTEGFVAVRTPRGKPLIRYNQGASVSGFGPGAGAGIAGCSSCVSPYLYGYHRYRLRRQSLPRRVL